MSDTRISPRARAKGVASALAAAATLLLAAAGHTQAQTRPGSTGDGLSVVSRKRARTTPSVR